jgi:carboxyl-terminal processing protease
VNRSSFKRTGWLAAASLSAVLLVSVAATPGGTPVAAVSRETSPPGTGRLDPAPYERELAGIVASMLETFHYEKQVVDDSTSSRWLDNYIEYLDFGRMVFLQSDIDEFQRYRTTLDDTIRVRPPDLEPAHIIYDRYQKRMRQRAAFALKLLEKPLDLTDAESYEPDRHDQKLAWPATDAEASDLWRKRTEDEIISELMSGRDTEEEVRDRLRKRYERTLKGLDDTESVDVLEMYLGALTRAYDPHSTWFKPARNDDFDISITNSVEGIGAQLKPDGDFTVVSEVVAGGPAKKDERLKKDDRILQVAQGDAEPVDVVGMRLDKVVKLIRGPKGSKVKLHVEHADGSREVVDLVRDRVMLEDSAAEAHVEQVGARKLGVVQLPSFYVDPSGRKTGRRASQDIKRQLGELKAQGVQGVILDLRGNGGGSLIEAIDVAGLFLPSGPIVQVRDRDGRIEALHDQDPTVAWDGPLLVLTDATSASASEIVAGALQDYGRAVVVGDQSTHGKGTVQQVAALTQQLRGRYEEEVGGSLKLTVQKFYRVSGGSTQNKGVEADVVLPSYWDGLEVHEGDQPFALPWDEIPQAPHVRTGEPTKAIPQLRTRSEARRTKSEDFSKLLTMLDEREKLENEPVSLVLTQRKAEYEERKARAGLEDETEEEENLTIEQRKAKAREADFVLDEALAILSDYVELK